jgi:hypothetical protein
MKRKVISLAKILPINPNLQLKQVIRQVEAFIELEVQMSEEWDNHIHVLKLLCCFFIILILLIITLSQNNISVTKLLIFEFCLPMIFLLEIIRMRKRKVFIHSKKIIVSKRLKFLLTNHDVDNLFNVSYQIQNNLVVKFIESVKKITALEKKGLNCDCTLQLRREARV